MISLRPVTARASLRAFSLAHDLADRRQLGVAHIAVGGGDQDHGVDKRGGSIDHGGGSLSGGGNGGWGAQKAAQRGGAEDT